MRTALTLTPYALPAVVTLLLKAGIYFYARFSRVHNRQTRIYLLFLFSLSMQNLAELVIFHDKAAGRYSSLGGILYFAASIFAVAFLLHLAMVVATRWCDTRVSWRTYLLLYSPALLLQFLLWCTSLFVIGFEPMGYTYTKIPGRLFFLWELYVLGYFGTAMLLLAHGTKNQLTPLRRLQCKYLLVGLAPFVAVATAVIVLQHLGFRWFNATGTLPLAITIFLVITAYAIHQHRLFDIEFFLPWSKVRKRKTQFYQRIQTLMTEIAQMPSALGALQSVSDLLHCQIALVGGEQPLATVPTSGKRTTIADGQNVDRMPRESLERVDRIVVAEEIAERDPALYETMRAHGVGAVVPFNLPRAIGHQWLVLGNQFSERVYTPLDFKQVEALFARIADFFLDDFLLLRSSFTTAMRRNDAQWRQQLRKKERQLSESEETVARLESDNSRLRARLLRRDTRGAGPLDSGKKTVAGYICGPGHSRIYGTGIYLPEQRITTKALLGEIDSKSRFGVPDHWLERVTGIREKRVAQADILPSDMAVAAARDAMERAKILPGQVEAIIYTGLTRDYLEPATAHVVQAKLGAMNAVVFDLANACHGFMNGIHVIDALIGSGQITCGLVVTGEKGSLFAEKAIESLTKTEQRDEFVLCATGFTLGDAGAAVVMGPKVSRDSGIVGFMLQSQGQFAHLCTAGGSIAGGPLFTDMPTQVREGGKMIKNMFDELMYRQLQWQVSELSKCLIHQIGTKGLFRVHQELLGIPTGIMPKTVDVLGNLVTANIPLALHYCIMNREIKEGDKIYLSGGGSGLSISQAGLVWDAP